MGEEIRGTPSKTDLERRAHIRYLEQRSGLGGPDGDTAGTRWAEKPFVQKQVNTNSGVLARIREAIARFTR